MADVEIARIEERRRFSKGGAVALFFLIIHQLVAGLALMAVFGAIQQAVVGTLWVAGNVLWGTAVMIGQERVYVVLRSADPPVPGR